MTRTRSSAGRWWKLSGVWFLYLAFGLTMASLAPLVAEIESDLQFSHAAMGSIMGAWQFVYIFAAIPCGLLLDRLGGKWGIFLGGVLIALSGLLRGLADSYAMLLLAVGLFGLGGPLISAGAPKIVSEHFVGSQRGLAMGIYITGPGIGAIAALLLTQPVLLPLLKGDWQRLLQFWGLVSLAAAVFWLLVVWRDSSGPRVTKGAQATIKGLQDLLDISAVRLILLMSVGVFAINHGMGNWLVEIIRAQGVGAERASLLASIPVAVGIVSALTLPRFATGERRFSVLRLLFASSILASLILLSHPSGPLLWVALIFEGIAAGSMMTVLILTLVEVPGVGQNRAGTAGGFFFAAAEIGGMGGPIMLGSLLAITGNFDSSLSALAVIGLLLLLSVMPLRKFLDRSENITTD